MKMVHIKNLKGVEYLLKFNFTPFASHYFLNLMTLPAGTEQMNEESLSKKGKRKQKSTLNKKLFLTNKNSPFRAAKG
jgi:hypothetical protein